MSKYQVTAEREARLPLWAQSELKRLRDVEAYLRDAMEAMNSSTARAFMVVYGGAVPRKVPLASENIGFQVGDTEFRVQIDEEKLEIRTDGMGVLVVRPMSSNAVYLESMPR